MQPGKDLSELYDTFWLLKQVEGSTQDLSHVVIYIDHTGINFSTPSYRLSMLFQYDRQTERKFFTPYVKGGDSKSSTYIQDQQVANAFENALQKIARRIDSRSLFSIRYNPPELKIAGGGLPSIVAMLPLRRIKMG
jgi:hypothetical protein